MRDVDGLPVGRDGEVAWIRIDLRERHLGAVLGRELEDESRDRPGTVAPMRTGARPGDRLAQVDVDEPSRGIGGEVVRALELHRNESDGDAEADFLRRRVDRGEQIASVVGGEEEAIERAGGRSIGTEGGAVEDGRLALSAR